VTREGSAISTLVLIPAVGLDARMFDRVVPQDRPSARHVLPGFGSRPRAARQPTMADLADEVAASHPGDLDLVGVSFGGMVAQHIALRHSGRVRSMMLVCTHAGADPALALERARAAEEGGMASVLGSTLARWFMPETLAACPEPDGVGYARATLLALDPRCYADGWRAMAMHQTLGRLSDVTAMTTCLAGTADTAAPPDRAREIAERIPGARLRLMEGAHMLPIERPREFAAELAEHLEWVDSASPRTAARKRTGEHVQ
jgi:3-oxoadipate enol-lactonase